MDIYQHKNESESMQKYLTKHEIPNAFKSLLEYQGSLE